MASALLRKHGEKQPIMNNQELTFALVITWWIMFVSWVCFGFILVNAVSGLERQIKKLREPME
jgi:hypothetical protein